MALPLPIISGSIALMLLCLASPFLSADQANFLNTETLGIVMRRVLCGAWETILFTVIWKEFQRACDTLVSYHPKEDELTLEAHTKISNSLFGLVTGLFKTGTSSKNKASDVKASAPTENVKASAPAEGDRD